MPIPDRFHHLPKALRDPEKRKRLNALMGDAEVSAAAGGNRRYLDKPSRTPPSLQTEMMRFFTSRDFDGLAVTLSFLPARNGQLLTEEIAASTLSELLKRLDKYCGGRARTEQLKVIAVREGSTRRAQRAPRLHYHLKIQTPDGLSHENFGSRLLHYWRKLDWASRHQNSFKPAADVGWLSYILKGRSKPDYAYAIDWLNTRV